MSSVSAFSSMPCSIRNLYNQQGPRSAISLPFLSTYIHNSSLSMQHHPQSRHSRPNPPPPNLSRLCLSCLFPLLPHLCLSSINSQNQGINSPLASQPARKPESQTSRRSHAPFLAPNQHFYGYPQQTRIKQASYGFTNQTNLIHPTPQTHRSSAVQCPMQFRKTSQITSNPPPPLPSLFASWWLQHQAYPSPPPRPFLQAQPHQRGKPNHTVCCLLTLATGSIY